MIYILVPLQTMSRDVMVLMNNNFEQKVNGIKIDKNGNHIILDMVIEEKEITFVNLYGPNEDKSSKKSLRN